MQTGPGFVSLVSSGRKRGKVSFHVLFKKSIPPGFSGRGPSGEIRGSCLRETDKIVEKGGEEDKKAEVNSSHCDRLLGRISREGGFFFPENWLAEDRRD